MTDSSIDRICVRCDSLIKYVGNQMWIDQFQCESCPSSEQLHSPKSCEVENADSNEC